jgi:signal transduction histidine kinase
MTPRPTFRVLLQRSFTRLTLVVSAVLLLQLTLLTIWAAVQLEQPEQSERLLLSVAKYHNVIRGALAQSEPEATRAFLAVLRESATMTLLAIEHRDELEESTGYGMELHMLQRVPSYLVQWIDNGQRHDSATMQPLGIVPTHWRAALTGATESATLSEPQGSPLLVGELAQTGLETLLIPVSQTRAVAMMSPSRTLSPLLDLRRIPWLMLAACIGVSLPLMVPALLSGAWMARRDSKPLSLLLAKIAQVAQRYQQEDFSARVEPLAGSAETVALGRALNELGQRLERTLGEVRASRSELQQLLELQRRVFTDISHELRTPLAAVMLHTELARETSDTPELRVIAEEAHNLQRLVQDIFDLVRLETGHLKLSLEPAMIGPILDSVVTAARLGAQKRGVLLRVSTDSHAELVVIADSQRLVQVLHNLVNNAIRHTPPGGQIELKALPLDAQVMIEVTDTGEGIAPENLPLIFDRFWRGDDARGRQGVQRSTGLGLAIVKELVEAIGGQVAMTSKQGIGTTAMIQLPRESGPAKVLAW